MNRNIRIVSFITMISIGAVVVVLLFVGCGGSSTGDSSSSGGGGVPYNVELAAMNHLSIDPSDGGEILSISGRKEDTYPDGRELWAISVKYRQCSQCGEQYIDTKMAVD